MSTSELFVDKRGCNVWIADGVLSVKNAQGDLEASIPLLNISAMREDPGLTDSSLSLCVSGETGVASIESGKWYNLEFEGVATSAKFMNAIRVAAKEMARNNSDRDPNKLESGED